MNLKSINNLFLFIILLLFFISCSKERSNIEIAETDTIETFDIIGETSFNKKNESFDFIETHSHTYYFPDHSHINKAVNILRYKDFQFNSLGHFLSDSLISYAPQTP